MLDVCRASYDHASHVANDRGPFRAVAVEKVFIVAIVEASVVFEALFAFNRILKPFWWSGEVASRIRGEGYASARDNVSNLSLEVNCGERWHHSRFSW